MADPRFIPLRVLVTGTRGKSSLVRLLHAGLSAYGLKTYARITGVLPRELLPMPEEVRVVRRTSPAHVREMLWWLRQLPSDAQAVVMENSAVTPELQAAAGDFLSPSLVVWTTLRPDHMESWGPDVEGAAKALVCGLPRGIRVVGGPDLNRPEVLALLRERGCEPVVLPPFSPPKSHEEENLALALRVCEACEAYEALLPGRLALAECAMRTLPPDVADFRILKRGRDELAAAFSANDVESTERLFLETGWTPEETTLFYHHRPDRPERLRVFREWIVSRRWKAVVFTRSVRPSFFALPWEQRGAWDDRIVDAASFVGCWEGRVFGCGNVAGWPLEFLLREEEMEWSTVRPCTGRFFPRA